MDGGGTARYNAMEEESRLTDDEETPHEVHVVPVSSQSRWSPIEDLDSFFARIYEYHQKHGFKCLVIQKGWELGQIVIIVGFATFICHMVDYDSLLAKEKISNNTVEAKNFFDSVLPTAVAISRMGFVTWLCLIMALFYFLFCVARCFKEVARSWEIKSFFETVLNIPDSEVDNVTWHEVQRRLLLVQKDHELCIHKRDLTELDICHRILRFKNYMVAMVNKNLLPVQLNIPFVGSTIFLTSGLKCNLELLLFRGPGSPFVNSWQLKDDYKRANNRKELAEALAKRITSAAAINLCLCLFIFLWQVLNYVFRYAEMAKRDPGAFGMRSWSPYARLYLRHFNELDHELNARLNRAYRPAQKYMDMFTSPILEINAKNVACISGVFLAYQVALAIIDEDVMRIQHWTTAMAILVFVISVCRMFMPPENLVWRPEKLMAAVLAQVHYLPDSWLELAHTDSVRGSFSALFPYKVVYILQECLSPFIIPYILYFKLRPKSLEMVDFFRQFTVDVVGVGDVCSFAQMDIRRNGNAAWQPHGKKTTTPEINQFTQAEDGKVELSLVHFTYTNPGWKPPAEAEEFVGRVRADAVKDLLPANDLGLLTSLALSMHSNSMSGLPGPYEALTTSFLNVRAEDDDRGVSNPFVQSSQNAFVMRGAVSRTEGPGPSADRGVIVPEPGGLRGAIADPHTSLGASMFGAGMSMFGTGSEVLHTDMAASALYLHSLHHRQTRRRGYVTESSVWQRPHQSSMAMGGIQEQTDERRTEKLPLLQKP